ncbi:hypothetical protein LTR84_010463 [Exophiala bonariae]|uniref:Uncharacterized protein n=1 Tax=Exophiala bonariae TaxID=1690606 RepID=A0AAV9MTS9_9EURO|nr:hypothetical protein LTR84_010463 [Exophiala bonariae]
MVGVKLTLGLFAALAVAGVALPGNYQWSDGDGVAAYGAGEPGGHNSNWGDAGGARGTGAAGGSGPSFGSGTQGGGGAMGGEGGSGKGSGYGDSHDGNKGQKGDHKEGGSRGNAPDGIHRRHENSDSSEANGSRGNGTQTGKDGNFGAGGDGEKSWGHGTGDGSRSGDRGDQGRQGGKGGDRGGDGKPGGNLGPRGHGAWGEDHEKDNHRKSGKGASSGKLDHGGGQGDKGDKGGDGFEEMRGGLGPRGNVAWGGNNQDGKNGKPGNGMGGGSSWEETGSGQVWPEDNPDHDGHRGTAERPGGGIRARDEEVDAPKKTLPSKLRVPNHHPRDEQDDIPKETDDGAPTIDLNDFNRRWAEAVEDDEAPDVRFHFDSSHPNAHVNTHHTRTDQLGVYECMYELFGMPCKFTAIVNGQCYNR